MRTDEGTISEAGWPCVRLRTAFALILFFFFEVLIGRKLPPLMPALALGLGSVFFVSAMTAIRQWKLAAQLALIQQAIEHGLD